MVTAPITASPCPFPDQAVVRLFSHSISSLPFFHDADIECPLTFLHLPPSVDIHGDSDHVHFGDHYMSGNPLLNIEMK